MCRVKGKGGCEQPERLKGKPKECTPEHIKECHGELLEDLQDLAVIAERKGEPAEPLETVIKNSGRKKWLSKS